MTTILIILLALLFVGALPTWHHSRYWGYRPSSSLGIILAVLLVLVILGKI